MSSPLLSWGLIQRTTFLAGLLALEAIGFSAWLNTETITRHTGLTGLLAGWGPAAVRALVAFAIIFLTFGFLTAGLNLRKVSNDLRQAPISLKLLSGHFGALLVFIALSSYLFSTVRLDSSTDAITGTWMVTGVAAALLAGLALLPLRFWTYLVTSTGKLWLYAALAGIAAPALGSLAWKLWDPATEITFRAVVVLLRPFLPSLIADPATHIIGTPSFSVVITQWCSGLEGIGLMLAFSSLWLWHFRLECRFPRSLLLIPAGVLVMWLANLVRIAALILLGNAGATAIAVGGFHSQAGWISFNVVALSFCLATRRLRWLRLPEVGSDTEPAVWANPAAPYLVPFLVIVAAGMVSGAFSSGFEWLYPLRFFAAAAVLWLFRNRYRDMDWHAGWRSAVLGVLVFVLWLGLDRIVTPSPSGIASGLSSWPTVARFAWLACRTLAAVITVPISEELAFRGFLLRRLISSDFESVDLKAFTWLSIAVSSLVFGIMHGDRWLAGTLAGLIFSAAFVRRGRIGDAVLAHATANALLATWVVLRGDWGLW